VNLRTLDNRVARQVFMDHHALLEPPAGPVQGQALLDLISRLGFVQLDSINTVARAHDLILFSRRPRYRADDLSKLYASGALFEHWTHDASVIPRAFFPYWHMRMQRDAAKRMEKWKRWHGDSFQDQFDTVLRHIREHGPCAASDLGKDEKKGSGGWWEWNPSKTALEYLWMSGALTVVRRENFRKIYDLTERVIEESYRHNIPSEAETINWCCHAALDRLGFASPGEIAKFWAHVTMAEAKAWTKLGLKTGALQEILITGADGRQFKRLARPELFENLPGQEPPARMRVLSPFDPMLRDRARAKALFGFDYTIEIFVPEPKRKYGYYVFPLLQKDRLVGRVDMKAQRDKDCLHIRALWVEPGIRWSPAKTRAFEAEATRVAKLAGVTQITWEPDWIDTGST
jgi:uncharacterized protein YcaQ